MADHNVGSYIDENGKIFINVVDVIYLIQNMIVESKEMGIDSTGLETLFIWFAQQHEKIEQKILENKAKNYAVRQSELNRLWDKYRPDGKDNKQEPYASTPDQSGRTDKENISVIDEDKGQT